MSLRFLVDTTVLSEPVKQGPNPAVLRRLEAHAEEIASCSIVWHELWYGVTRLPASRRKRTLEAYLLEVVESTLPILPYDAGAAIWHGRERGRLARAGIPTSFADGQIAAIAALHELTVVTPNIRDFSVFRGLRVVDWAK